MGNLLGSPLGVAWIQQISFVQRIHQLMCRDCPKRILNKSLLIYSTNQKYSLITRNSRIWTPIYRSRRKGAVDKEVKWRRQGDDPCLGEENQARPERDNEKNLIHILSTIQKYCGWVHYQGILRLCPLSKNIVIRSTFQKYQATITNMKAKSCKEG